MTHTKGAPPKILTDDEIDRLLLTFAIAPGTRRADRKAAIAELRRVAHTRGPKAILIALLEELER